MSIVSLLDFVNNPKSDIVDGPFGSNMKSSDYVDSGVPVIKLQNIKANKFLPKNIDFVTKEKAEEIKRHSYQAGDIVVTKLGDPLGISCIMPNDFPNGIIVADLIRIRPNHKEVDTKFLCYQLNSPTIANQFKDLTKGTTRPRVNLTLVRDIQAWKPKLEVQRKVVSRIERLFSEIDSASEELKKTKQRLELYKQSVLNAAIRGKLVPQDPNDMPTTKFLEHIRVEKEKLIKEKKFKKERTLSPIDPGEVPFELPKGWEWARIREIGHVQLGRQRAPQHHNGKNMRKYLRVANVFENFIDTSDVMEMNFTPDEFKNFKLEYGDILLNEGQSLELVGRPAMFKNEVEDCCFQNTLIRFRAKEMVDREYALLVFLAYLKNGRFQKIAGWTTSIAHLGAQRFAELEFPVPPILEQKRITKAANQAIAEAKSLIQDAESLRKSIVRLKQSILKSAFEGKLL